MKKALVLVLCFAMILMLAVGCAPAVTTTTTTASAGQETTAATTQGPPVKINYIYPLFGGVPVDQQNVNDAVNEISLAKANVTVEMIPISIANYNEQVNMKLISGEEVDLMVTLPGGPTFYPTMAANNQLNDLSDLAPQFAQGAIDAFDAINPGYLAGAYIGGKLYGFPALFDKVSNMHVTIRKDVLDKYNLDLTKIKNITDLEAIVKVLAANESIPVFTGNSANGYVLLQSTPLISYDDFSKDIASEFFGSDGWAFGAVIGTDNTKVINFYASDFYKKGIEMTRDWYNKGYISKDAATNNEPTTNIIAANGALGTLAAGELGVETSMNNRCKHEMVTVKIANGIVNTGIIQKFVWTIPFTCINTEAALKFLNLTYTDAEILNLINYGIKDVHYVENAQGQIAYPDGVDTGNSSYNVNASFMFGSQYLTKVWATDPVDLRDQMRAVNGAAKTSTLMGYTFNPSNVTDAFTAVSNVITQYAVGLNTGSSDPATDLPKFLAALDAAGMESIITENQKQIDEFTKNKK